MAGRPNARTIQGMGSVTSSMTVAQIEAVYLDNCSYAEDESASKAKAFQSAVRALILKLSSTMTKGANSLSYNREQLGGQLKEVTEWIALHPASSFDQGGPTVTRVDFRNGRQ